MSKILNLINDINEEIEIIEYVATKEDAPGLSRILIKVASNLELIRCELEAMREEEKAS